MKKSILAIALLVTSNAVLAEPNTPPTSGGMWKNTNEVSATAKIVKSTDLVVQVGSDGTYIDEWAKDNQDIFWGRLWNKSGSQIAAGDSAVSFFSYGGKVDAIKQTITLQNSMNQSDTITVKVVPANMFDFDQENNGELVYINKNALDAQATSGDFYFINETSQKLPAGSYTLTGKAWINQQ